MHPTPTRIDDANISTLSIDGTTAKLRASVHVLSKERLAQGTVQIELVPENFAGSPIHLPPRPYAIANDATQGSDLNLDFDVPDAKLWWTWDLGAQNLYRAEVKLLDDSGRSVDSASTTFGIRTVERDSNIQYRINGRKVLMRGAWYAMSRLYPASTSRWTYEQDLRLARNANMNHLVNYTVIEKDEFYDLADQLGILLFIELPFNQEGPIDALNDAYPRRAQFLDWSAGEVTQIVKQLRNHPSVGVWAPVSEVTENSPEISVSWDKRVGEAKNGYNMFLQRMQGVVEQADADALYFRSYCDFGEHHFWEGAFFNGTTYDQQFDAGASFVSEYGAEGLFSVESAAAITDVGKLWDAQRQALSPIQLPIDVKSFSYLHPWQSFGLDFTTTAVGVNVTRALDSYRDYANASQIYQAFIYGYAGDAYRRKAFAPINGIRSWMLKSFPEVPIGGFGVIDTFDVPTQAYYEQKRTFAPVTLSFALRTPLESVAGGSDMQVPIWISNIESTALPDLSIDAALYDLQGTQIWSRVAKTSAAPYQAVAAASADFKVPQAAGIYLLRAHARQAGKEIAAAASFIKVASPATRRPLRVLVVGSPEWANPVAEYAEGLGAKITLALTENTVIRPLRFPATAGEIHRDYDVIWLAGYNSYWREAPESVTSTILQAVREGTTFVHSGSAGSFHGGGDINNKAAGLDLTPLAELLPVLVKHENDVYFKSAFHAGKQPNQLAQPTKLLVTATDKAPAWLRETDLTAAAPDNFHMLEAKSDATILVELGDLPLLVTGHYGKGRTIAYLGFGPEGSPIRDHVRLVLDRAITESAARRGFGIMSAAILALASGDGPPEPVSRLIEERAVPLFESVLAAKGDTTVTVTARWVAGPAGSTVGHLRIVNGKDFNYRLRIDLVGSAHHSQHHLSLWDNQYFDLLPHETADTDVTIVREPGAPPERLWVMTESAHGEQTRFSELEVPSFAQAAP